MDCFLDDCDEPQDADAQLTVDYGDHKERKPACEQHRGRTVTSNFAHERSRNARRDSLTRPEETSHSLNRDYSRLDGRVT